MITKESFINGLSNLFPYHIIEGKGDYLVVRRNNRNNNLLIEEETEDIFAKIKMQEIISAINEASENNSEFHDNVLHKDNLFEFPVETSDGRLFSLHRRLERDKYSISGHGYSLQLSKASKQYKVNFICNCTNEAELSIQRILYRFDKIGTLDELFDIIQIYVTVLESPKGISFTQAKNIVQSYLFNIAFNYNFALDIAVFSRQERHFLYGHMRGNDGQIFPYKQYNAEIIKYYYQGLSTDIPFAQYLAFYHVIEFYFQSITERDIFDEITNTITSPDFSPYKKESLRSFYKKIKKKMNEQKEDGVGNEKNALKLCLIEYIKDLNHLEETIKKIDPNAIEYYNNIPVPFADDGKVIDFSSSPENTIKCLCDRIYATRNAIVHSKESEKKRYTPFKHDKELKKRNTINKSCCRTCYH